MKLLFFVFLFPVLAFAAPKEDSMGFNFLGAPLGQVVSLYFDKVVKRPYVLCDEVIQDQRPVSLRATRESLDSAVISALIDSMGYESREIKGVVTICKSRPDNKKIIEPEKNNFVYKVQYRDSGYLAELLQPMFNGQFANRRGVGQSITQSPSATGKDGLSNVQPLSSSTSSNPKLDDFLLFTGIDSEISKLEKLLTQIDIPGGDLMLKAYFYEVTNSQSDGSALTLVASLLSSRLSLSVGTDKLANSLKLSVGGIDVVASALATDSRFKLMSSPSTRVRNGATARFVVGEEVPILSAFVTSPTGQLTQSYERRDAGVIFEVTPRSRSKQTDVDLFQQISSFVAQDASDSKPPRLSKREMRSSLSLDTDEIIVIGGLNENRSENNESGLSFFPWKFSKSSTSKNSELVLILQLKKI